MEVGERDAQIGHEATVSKIADEQLFYLMSRGLSQEQAMGMVVNGFIEPITRTLPMEYAVEWSRLIELRGSPHDCVGDHGVRCTRSAARRRSLSNASDTLVSLTSRPARRGGVFDSWVGNRGCHPRQPALPPQDSKRAGLHPLVKRALAATCCRLGRVANA
jgi:hypothetical protein